MFEMNPRWVEHFSAFKGKTLDEIKKTDRISILGGEVIQELANWFGNIQMVRDVLRDQGNHYKNRSIGIEYFKNVLPVVDATLAQQMGSAYTAAMKGAVDAAWSGVIVPGLKAGY